jgi:hypothetical protein
MPRFYFVGLAAVGTLLLGGACSGSGGIDCAEGAERCPCFSNGTCDAGLTCASDLCVALDGSGGGGAVANGGAGQGASGNDGGAAAGRAEPARGPCIQIAFVGDDASDSSTAPDQFVDWMIAGGATVTRIAATASLSASQLEPLHVVVVGNMTAQVGGGLYDADDVANLRDWVEAGGGLVTLAGHTADELAAQPADLLLEPLGLGYDYAGRGPGVLGEGEPPMVTSGIIGADHPAMANVSSLGVYFAYPVEGDGVPLVEEQGFVLAMAKEVGRGRVFAFGDEYSTFVSEWATHTELQHERLWTNVLDWLGAPAGCQFPK